MKNKLNYLFALLATAFVLVGCEKKEETPAMPGTNNVPAIPAPPK